MTPRLKQTWHEEYPNLLLVLPMTTSNTTVVEYLDLRIIGTLGGFQVEISKLKCSVVPRCWSRDM
jgi:hypothetical protein